MVYALLCHGIALRLSERKTFLPKSRVVVAGVPNVFGYHLKELLSWGFAGINKGQLPDIPQDITYYPLERRPGEPEESTMLAPYTVRYLHTPEQTTLERKLQRFVLVDRSDGVDKLQVIPPGQLPDDWEPDYTALGRAAARYLANKKTIEQRLAEQWTTSTMTIDPLQVRLYRTDVSSSSGAFDIEIVDISRPGLSRNYLS